MCTFLRKNPWMLVMQKKKKKKKGYNTSSAIGASVVGYLSITTCQRSFDQGRSAPSNLLCEIIVSVFI
jgi:hypothetical protein